MGGVGREMPDGGSVGYPAAAILINSSALSLADLVRLLTEWQALPEKGRAAILQILAACSKKTP